MNTFAKLLPVLLMGSCVSPTSELEPVLVTAPPWPPESYVCYRAPEPTGSIQIDGRLDDAAWDAAEWTQSFIDIEGNRRPLPRQKTRVKMLWDDEYFYVAAELEEFNVWATLTQRDSVIFHDNDFELFFDPDGDTHNYGEFEINAFGTEWDLLLGKPYRDGGPAINEWDIDGLRTAVHVDGTINEPRDHDRGWSVEIAVPWKGIAETRNGSTRAPEPGETWRVNYSRVQWRVDYIDGPFRRLRDPVTGKRLPEDNWVWSQQGAINMHRPEMWGFVQFSTETVGGDLEAFRWDPKDDAAFALRQIYYAQREYLDLHGTYASDLAGLGLREPPAAIAGWETVPAPPRLAVTENTYEAVLTLPDERTLKIDQQGRLSVTNAD
jgi:hypothetical protein